MPNASLPEKTSPPTGALYVRWREWSGLKTNLAWIYEGELFGTNRRGKWHPDHMAAWLIKRGSVTLRQEGKATTASAGEWMVPWPGYRYQEFSDDARILSVRFQAAWPDGKPLFERGLSIKFPAARFPRLEIVARQLLETARPVIPGDPVQLSTASIPFDNFLEVKVVTLRWLSEIYNTLCALGLRPSRLGICDERIVSALQRLDQLALSQKLAEGRLASEFGLSVSQFVRLFRQELGETPKQYFDQRRRYYCHQMLAGTAVPIKEIAYNLGFTRLSDFSTWFRKHCGIAPRRFREEAKEPREV
jgi:AraC-like DNA-binding protein